MIQLAGACLWVQFNEARVVYSLARQLSVDFTLESRLARKRSNRDAKKAPRIGFELAGIPKNCPGIGS